MSSFTAINAGATTTSFPNNNNNSSGNNPPPPAAPASQRTRTALPTRRWEDDEQEWMERVLVEEGGVAHPDVTWQTITDAYNLRWQNEPILNAAGNVIVYTRGPRTVDALQQRFAPRWNAMRRRLDEQTTAGQPAVAINWQGALAAMQAAEAAADDEDPLQDLEDMVIAHREGRI